MRARELLHAVMAFVQARWLLRSTSRAAIERRQQRRLRRWMARSLPLASFYAGFEGQSLADLPIVDKAMIMSAFDAFNTRAISLDDARGAALRAEAGLSDSRHDDLSFGLSSGTRGPPGVFITSRVERARWVGIMLARTLTPAMLKRMIRAKRPLRIAFFLRANSGLYKTLDSRRITLRFFDMTRGLDAHLLPLQELQPEVLVAPATVLAWLAERQAAGLLALCPERVVSVAEVLDRGDAARIGAAFAQPVHQIYQCTEGFLGITCEAGTLHLNEEYVHVEPEWLDEEKLRFTPIVTDFTRTTQLFARYRLDDVLQLRRQPCPCGRKTVALAAIEGRCDDVLWLRPVESGSPIPLFPDALRHIVAHLIGPGMDYRLEQRGDTFELATMDGDPATFATVRIAFDRSFEAQGLRLPTWKRVAYASWPSGSKRRRIVCVTGTDAN